MTNRAFAELDPPFSRLCAKIGRPSVPPEQVLRALLLQRAVSEHLAKRSQSANTSSSPASPSKYLHARRLNGDEV